MAEYENAQHEELGSREKFWIVREDGARWLFKRPRVTNPGEAWSEKLAAEIGNLIGVPCAVVELARDIHGIATLSRSFRQSDWQYYHGNNVLANFVTGYDLSRRFGQNDHNVKNIVKSIAGLDDVGILNSELAMSRLASYAILDGLIGNTDRHHENWMIMLIPDTMEFQVAPSYDHASSLGREMQDSRRQQIISEKRILNYILGGGGKRGKGRVYVKGDSKLPLAPLRLAQLICRWQPHYTQSTIERMRAISNCQFRTVIDKVPPSVMSDVAKEFAYHLVCTSKAELLRRTK